MTVFQQTFILVVKKDCTSEDLRDHVTKMQITLPSQNFQLSYSLESLDRAIQVKNIKLLEKSDTAFVVLKDKNESIKNMKQFTLIDGEDLGKASYVLHQAMSLIEIGKYTSLWDSI